MKVVNATIQDILRAYFDGKTIIGFGAGMAFDTFCNNMFLEYRVEKIFSAIADNNILLSGTKRQIRGNEILIDSIENIIKRYNHIDIIIITNQYLKMICDQLARFSQLSDTQVIFYGFVIDQYLEWKYQTGDMTGKVFYESGIEIPKIIHYCWFGKGKIPDRYRDWMKSWKRFCPDYEIIEWNEDNYDVWKNDYMAEAYEAKKWGFVPDYARLDIVYRYGGIYLDTDVEIIQSLDPLLHQQGFCGFSDAYYVNLGLGFGAVAKNNCIRMMRDDYDKRHFRNTDGSLNQAPCAIYQIDVLTDRGLIPNGEFQCIPSMTVYPKEFFSPMNLYDRRLKKTKNTFTIHYADSSWVDKDRKKEIMAWGKYGGFT